VFRKLRVFAMDPGLTARFETAVMNEMTLSLPWEDLEPGPVGEYVAVVDVDEHGKLLFDPVDLNRSDLLARDGLTPSDGDPQFHQQMVYAVAMRTIRTFERALGRLVHWPLRQVNAHRRKVEYVERLTLHPHYMQEPNAYYWPETGSLRFGYFLSGPNTPVPDSHVFVCLSQDVIAHEITHALLRGMNVTFESDGTNLDVAAFHEAFADLVALFLHFWESDVLRAQIAAARGRLDQPSPLGAIALQFGQAMGFPDGLRNAFGKTIDGVWTPRRPDPQAARTEQEPHARGDILVGAVFEAFRKVYESRVADLRRIASRGSGELPAGSLHPDLVNRFTREAACSAELVLQMCIRAIDYMPPVGVTFGDFLRAALTADYDLNPADPHRYRQAFTQAFREYGICPKDVGTVSAQTLLWPGPESTQQAHALLPFMKKLSQQLAYWSLPRERAKVWHLLEEKKLELAKYLQTDSGVPKRLGAIDLRKPFEVQSLHARPQTGAAGDLSSEWVIKLVQPPSDPDKPTGGPRAGSTFLVDADTGLLRYQIDKPLPPRRARKKDAALVPNLLPLAKGDSTLPAQERRLRVFAFDPTMGIALETAGINEVVLGVPWERDRLGNDVLEPGPVGEYLEVVDRDPSSRAFYAPVDLNDRYLLAQCGLTPSESNPQFHQQMVYAVAMRTIRTFERALGRLALWSPRPAVPPSSPGGEWQEEQYVQRLRVYPHALREPNAYYSPLKKALLFGYFSAAGWGGSEQGSSVTVFTCLSHDIVAHETTHALLDGMHRRFNEPSNPDVLAFHEAFADLVALFQHFSLPEVLRHQVAASRGDLESQNRLGELAQQFGQATGKRGALRSALGSIDPTTGEWKRAAPDPDAYRRLKEPHDRGALLVAAVFDAFLSIYKAAVADLLRIASDGTGVLAAGHLHPDLVNRLADEAAQSAAHVLNMCIRALDYCPPVDLTYGDYLRAIVTADTEFDPVDEAHRRVAFVEAFRRHGIVPEDVRTLSVDGLLWRPTTDSPDEDENIVLGLVQKWAPDIASWNQTRDRKKLYELMKKKRAALHSYLEARQKKQAPGPSGIDPSLPVEVHSIRPSFRTDWEGRPRFQWVIELTQRVPQWDGTDGAVEDGREPDYYFRGGCTLVVDAETGKVRYSIRKRLNDTRRERQRRYLLEDGNETLAATYFGGIGSERSEPFAMLHRL